MKTSKFLNWFGLSLMAAMLFMTTGCGSDKADKLLSTVPSKSAVVASVNVQAIAENAGAKVEGSKIALPRNLKEAISSNLNPGITALLTNGKSGVDFSMMVFFTCEKGSFLTGLLLNEDDFKATLEKESGSKFESSRGVEIIEGMVAFKDGQFWFGSDVTAEKIASFTDLDEKESMAGSKAADKLNDADHAVSVVSNISSLFDLIRNASAASSMQVSQMEMGLNLAFEKAKYCVTHIDLDGKKLKFDLKVYNKEMEPSRFLLEMDKVNATTVRALNVDANMFAALSLSDSFLSRLLTLASEMGGNPISPELANSLGGGTVAFAVGSNGGWKAGIDTKGMNDDLKQLAGDIASGLGASASAGGDRLFVKSPNLPEGAMTASTAAGYFKNCIMGFVMTTKDLPGNNMPQITAKVIVSKDGDSVETTGEVETPEPFLEYILTYN